MGWELPDHISLTTLGVSMPLSISCVYIVNKGQCAFGEHLACQGPFPEQVMNKERREELSSSSLPAIKGGEAAF